MTQSIVDFETAQTDLLAAAAHLAGTIKSSDGHAEAVREIVPFYLAKDDVDAAAQLADSVEDPFVRDKLLIDVAEKCAALDDDEYALQLADAIEDVGLQAIARERVAVQKAVKNEFDKATAIIETLDHPSDALAAVAVRRALGGDEEGARRTISQIEFHAARVNALQEIALGVAEKGDTEKANEFLTQAHAEAKEIEFAEEKIRALVSIAGHYTENGRADRGIEIFSEAQSAIEKLGGAHRESLLSTVSVGFLQAGSLDLADRALDLISDKTHIAATLAAFAEEFDRRGESGEALEALEESYAVLKSQRDREVRDTPLKFGVLEKIAVLFARFGKSDRALEAAAEIASEKNRFSALAAISKIQFEKSDGEAGARTLDLIEDELTRVFALINFSDAKRKAGEAETALKFLDEADALSRHPQQLPLRVAALNRIAERYSILGETEKARGAAGESLRFAARITDESEKAVALARMSGVYQNLGFDLDETDRETLRTILRRAGW